MCGATVDAFFELSDAGLVSSGSVMVPCPWFPDVAARCRARANAGARAHADATANVDVGVHLTLTSEWDGYRWAPVFARDPASGLVDEEGYFHRNQDRWRGIDPVAVRAEAGAQIDRALAAGLDLTHVDSHMFAVLDPALAVDYVGLGAAHGLPVLMTRQPQWVAILSEPVIAGWEQQGLPVFDHLREMPLGDGDGDGDEPARAGLDAARRLFDELPPGLTYLITHPAHDTPELRAVARDWRQRAADFETFSRPELGEHLRRIGVQVISWRPLRELLRSRCVSA
ncbi:MAG: ChbG/HpnK family deacetylase [Acidimicrobiia bacterium]|nr:ChbG/HpnK family deacetylase [Acidimicrobiia bacterium]